MPGIDIDFLTKAEQIAQLCERLQSQNMELKMKVHQLSSPWLSIEQIAVLLSVDRKFARKWAEGLPEFRSGPKICRYRRQDVEARIEANTVKKKK